MGKKAGKTFGAYYYDITGGIEPLLAWCEVPAQAVYDATLRGLMRAGVSRASATNVTEGFKISINLFI